MIVIINGLLIIDYNGLLIIDDYNEYRSQRLAM